MNKSHRNPPKPSRQGVPAAPAAEVGWWNSAKAGAKESVQDASAWAGDMGGLLLNSNWWEFWSDTNEADLEAYYNAFPEEFEGLTPIFDPDRPITVRQTEGADGSQELHISKLHLTRLGAVWDDLFSGSGTDHDRWFRIDELTVDELEVDVLASLYQQVGRPVTGPVSLKGVVARSTRKGSASTFQLIVNNASFEQAGALGEGFTLENLWLRSSNAEDSSVTEVEVGHVQSIRPGGLDGTLNIDGLHGLLTDRQTDLSADVVRAQNLEVGQLGIGFASLQDAKVSQGGPLSGFSPDRGVLEARTGVTAGMTHAGTQILGMSAAEGLVVSPNETGVDVLADKMVLRGLDTEALEMRHGRATGASIRQQGDQWTWGSETLKAKKVQSFGGRAETVNLGNNGVRLGPDGYILGLEQGTFTQTQLGDQRARSVDVQGAVLGGNATGAKGAFERVSAAGIAMGEDISLASAHMNAGTMDVNDQRHIFTAASGGVDSLKAPNTGIDRLYDLDTLKVVVTPEGEFTTEAKGASLEGFHSHGVEARQGRGHDLKVDLGPESINGEFGGLHLQDVKAGSVAADAIHARGLETAARGGTTNIRALNASLDGLHHTTSDTHAQSLNLDGWRHVQDSDSVLSQARTLKAMGLKSNGTEIAEAVASTVSISEALGVTDINLKAGTLHDVRHSSGSGADKMGLTEGQLQVAPGEISGGAHQMIAEGVVLDSPPASQAVQHVDLNKATDVLRSAMGRVDTLSAEFMGEVAPGRYGDVEVADGTVGAGALAAKGNRLTNGTHATLNQPVGVEVSLLGGLLNPTVGVNGAYVGKDGKPWIDAFIDTEVEERAKEGFGLDDPVALAQLATKVSISEDSLQEPSPLGDFLIDGHVRFSDGPLNVGLGEVELASRDREDNAMAFHSQQRDGQTTTNVAFDRLHGDSLSLQQGDAQLNAQGVALGPGAFSLTPEASKGTLGTAALTNARFSAPLDANPITQTPDARVVPGAGGWVYRQHADGRITIVDGPSAVGKVLTSGRAHAAITKEIGPYR